MNIISNTCLGAYITRDFIKEKYQNPFQWNIIDFSSMKNLIENYDNITDMSCKVSILKDNDYPSLLLDDKINVQYVHIKKLSKKYKLLKNQNDIYIKDSDILEYTLFKFKNRLNRQHEDPIFILHYQPNHPITGKKKELLNLYNTIKTKYPIIIITDDRNITSHDNILVMHLSKNLLDAPKKVSEILGPIIAKDLKST